LAWRLINVSQAWGARPSSLIGVENDYVAYCLDEALSVLNNGINERVNAVAQAQDRKAASIEAKMRRELSKILGIDDSEQYYRTPSITK
jgi:hypothetical protein